MSDAAERLMTLPTFRDLVARREAETVAKTAAKTAADDLVDYFMEKRDTPSPDALGRIRGCTDPGVLKGWLRRAWRGETSAQIFDVASSS
jgi:hypothetical protein